MRRNPAQPVRRHQPDEQTDGQADAPGQRAHRVLAATALAQQMPQRLRQAGEDDQQHQDDKDFHVLRRKGCDAPV
jgi:hypothetical protein